MTKSKILIDISISAAQAIVNQLSGIVGFFIITRYLDKASLGHLNWVLAVLMVVFSVLGFGLEPVGIRKAATGSNLTFLLQTYLTHVIITGTAFIGLLCIIWFEAPSLRQDGNTFLLLAIGQALSFVATPFRQIINGLEKFNFLFIMSSCANIIKVVFLLMFALFQKIDLAVIITIYVAASFAELLLCIFIYKVTLGLPLVPGFSIVRYVGLIKEALPQLGITIFNTAVQRMDWVLLGLLSTAITVAEYSFTNKLFELATLPLLIIAPVLFPRIAKLFAGEITENQINKTGYLETLVRIEIIIAVFIALLLNTSWTPIMDMLTNNKYGLSTEQIIFLMSFAMPLVYMNNIFWSILFAQQKMQTLFYIFFGSFLVNIVADLLLIPLYQAKGAALGFVIAICLQSILYYRKLLISEIKQAIFHLFPVLSCALIAGFSVRYFFSLFEWRLLVASAIYVALLVLLQQVKYKDWLTIQKMIKR